MLSKSTMQSIKQSSWIRKMFEEGNLLKEKYGPENISDLSLGNPTLEPPQKVIKTLKILLESEKQGNHRYMSNAGFFETRNFLAKEYEKKSLLQFTAEHFIMTVGAGGGLNVVIKTLCNPNEEIIVFSPYFVEYVAYARNHNASVKVVPTNEDFSLNLEALKQNISEKTKIVLINSPNNPTGVVYSQKEIIELSNILKEQSEKYKTNIILLSDEPYRNITYDDTEVPFIFDFYENSIVVTSYSKDLALAGERIGYIAISPKCTQADLIAQGCSISLRVLGFVNAPALMQRLLPLVKEEKVDISIYKKNRDILYPYLNHLGFSCIKPQGAFYLFPKSPIKDDITFVKEAQKEHLLLTPGSGFGKSGYFRISYCFANNVIEQSLPKFAMLAKKFDLTK